MTPARLLLKRPTGWFAAGQEVAAALEVLSGDAFKLYVYLCLHAERQTGRIADDPDDAARLFPSIGQSQVAWKELFRQQVCVRRETAWKSATGSGPTKEPRLLKQSRTWPAMSNRFAR